MFFPVYTLLLRCVFAGLACGFHESVVCLLVRSRICSFCHVCVCMSLCFLLYLLPPWPLVSVCCISLTYHQTLCSIPPKEETIIDIELTTLQKRYYRAIYERNIGFLRKVSGHLSSFDFSCLVLLVFMLGVPMARPPRCVRRVLIRYVHVAFGLSMWLVVPRHTASWVTLQHISLFRTSDPCCGCNLLSLQGCTSGNYPRLLNIEMQLRKCCNHPWLVESVEEKESSADTSDAVCDRTVLFLCFVCGWVCGMEERTLFCRDASVNACVDATSSDCGMMLVFPDVALFWRRDEPLLVVMKHSDSL